MLQIHFGPFLGPDWNGTALADLSGALVFLSRLAVPFFFAAAGYFLQRTARADALSVRATAQAKRLLRLYVVWSLIALLVRASLRGLHHASFGEMSEPVRRAFESLREHPLNFLFQGPEEPLWFLPALALSVVLHAALESDRRLRSLAAPLAIALAVSGVASGAYGLGSLPESFNPRNGPFFSFPLVLAGARLARRPRPGVARSTIVLVAGLCIMTLEAWCLRALTGAQMRSHDALLGCFVAGPALLALGLNVRGRAVETLARISPLTLAVYCCHSLVAFIVLEVSRRTALRGSFPGEAGTFLAIVALSFACARLLQGQPIARRLLL